MISISAWWLSSLRPLRLGAIRCITAGHWSLVGEERMSKSGREQFTSPECIQRMHQAQVAENTESWTSFGIGLNGGDKHGNMLSYSNNAEVHDVRIPQGRTAALGWVWVSLRMSSHGEVSDWMVSEKQTSATLNATLHCKKSRFLLLWRMMVMDDPQGVMKHTRAVSHCSQKAQQVWTEESLGTRKWLPTQLLTQKNLGLWIKVEVRIHTQNVGPHAPY